MAYLVKCSLCGRDVSSEAKACPGCGHDVAGELQQKERDAMQLKEEEQVRKWKQQGLCQRCGNNKFKLVKWEVGSSKNDVPRCLICVDSKNKQYCSWRLQYETLNNNGNWIKCPEWNIYKKHIVETIRSDHSGY